MHSPAVQRAFTRRIRALERELPTVLDEDVEGVHRSRVASRRLRELLPVLGLLGADGKDRELRKLRSRVKRLTRALGGVRELDVTVGILEDLRLAHPELGVALEAARVAVDDDRRWRRQEMSAQLENIRAFELADELLAYSGDVGGESVADRASRLRCRLERRGDRLEGAVIAAGALYAFDRLHLVRIAVKQLRYTLELVHEFGRVPALRLITRLKQFQESLGRLHDLEIVAASIRRAGAGLPSMTAEIERVLGLVEREARELHAVYLARVGLLADMIAKCRGEIDAKLGAGTVPRRRA